MSSISIVIPLWNGCNLIPACLESLNSERLHDGSTPELIVVDNASVDGSAEWVATNMPQVTLLRHRNNLGFGGGCNRGLRSAHGEILVLLNQDTVVYPGWLCAIEQAFNNPKVGIAGCKIYYPDGKTIQHAGGQIDWPGGNGSHIGYREQDTGEWDEARPVEWVTGAAMAIRRSVYETIGGLDEEFWPGYFEDVDYCLRAREQGFEVWYIPTAVLQHQESASIRNPKELQRIHDRNRMLCWLKHTPPEQWLGEIAQFEENAIRNSSNEDLALRQINCLELSTLAPSLLTRYWQAEAKAIEAIVDTLQRMAKLQSAQWRVVESEAGSTTLESLVPPIPQLTEYEFRSQLPIVGMLFSSFRRFSYNIATRWVIRHLNRQLGDFFQQQYDYEMQVKSQVQQLQQLVNSSAQQQTQLQFSIDNLQHQMEILVKRNAQLSHQLLQVEHQIEESQQ